MSPSQLRPSGGEVGIQLYRPLELGLRGTKNPRRDISGAQLLAAKIGIVCIEVLRWSSGQLATSAVTKSDVQRPGDLTRDVGLNLKDVGQRAVERLLPAGAGVMDLDKLRAHLHPALPARALIPPHGTAEEVLHPEFLPDLLGSLGRFLVLA